MTVAALAAAGETFRRPDWIATAETVFTFLCRNMTRQGRLGHSWKGGQLKHAAVIDDYAHMMRAALALFAVTEKTAYLDQAEAWAKTADRHYWDDAPNTGGGYFLTADDTTDVITRAKTVADNAVPSGNSVMAEVLAKLFILTGNDRVVTVLDGLFPSLGIGTLLYESISVMPHYDAFVRGLIDLASVVYFALMSGLFLWANALVLERNRS